MPVQTQMQVRRGTASSWTSTNPTLAAGELGFETDTGKFKIGTGSSTWTALSYAGGGQNTLTTYQYTATAGQTTFSGADANGNTLSYTAGAVQVYLNGALLANTTDYAASNGTSVVLTGGAGLSDSLTILSLGSFTVSTDIPKSTLTAKGSIVAASGAATPANLSVGTNNQVLTADSSTATGLKWAAPDPLTTKGDLFTYSTVEDRLGVGANDTVLTADSSTATGLKWATPAAGGMTLLSTTTLSGATTTISSINQTYNTLFVLVRGMSLSGNEYPELRPNAATEGSYVESTCNTSTVQTVAAAASALRPYSGNNNFKANTTSNAYALTIYNYASTTSIKPFDSSSSHENGSSARCATLAKGGINTNSAITSLQFVSGGSTTFNGGTVLVYGVK